EPLIQALAAGATAQVALRLHWRLALGASAVAVMVATLPLLAAGLATLGARGRRIVGWSVAGVAVFSVAGGALGGLAALQAKSSVDRGVRAARDGLSALSRDDRDEARSRFAPSTRSPARAATWRAQRPTRSASPTRARSGPSVDASTSTRYARCRVRSTRCAACWRARRVSSPASTRRGW